MSDDDTPTPKKAPDESVAKLRKLADDNPDNSLFASAADAAEGRSSRQLTVTTTQTLATTIVASR